MSGYYHVVAEVYSYTLKDRVKCVKKNARVVDHFPYKFLSLMGTYRSQDEAQKRADEINAEAQA